MWSLKVADSGGGSPLLCTGNGFLGRAVWDFDAGGGTPEERAEVERLRQSTRLQPNLSAVVVQDNQDVTEETILSSLRQALNQYSTLQAHDGHWPGDYSGILFIMPLLDY
uniref:Squalene cyclase N-terminal domain-containing protein n=1 Tax=Oryza brachyantha TaxID=4533 RepID=J3N7I9_ORYBR